jgi:diguanylate cyclase (GGDEF)-like protein/PAS domain S-box-containing protein
MNLNSCLPPAAKIKGMGMKEKQESEKNNTQSEDILRDSESRYRRLFETAKDGILLLDAVTGQITDVNPFLVDLLGYSYQEFLGKKLWEIGSFKDAIASQTAFQELRQKKYIRYEELPLVTKTGIHVEVEFVSNLYEVNGKNVIQCNIRDISERKRDEGELQKANEELSELVLELKKHDLEMKSINRMNDLLQACKTKEEAYQVIALALGELFPDQGGALVILHDSGQYLETIAQWGEASFLEPIFSLEDCWAMRRGQQHLVLDLHESVICNHFIRPPTTGYLCLPLVVQGETLGLLYLESPSGINPAHVLGWNQLAVTIGEGIKLSLSNLKLRELMREQATHDPLTGLFNRRYLNESLPRELNRAHRQNQPTCLAMMDIDHFKRVNDTYGHEAGDLVLRELGRILRENTRKSDIVCRFGGEEFLLVLLDSPLADCHAHLEKIRQIVKGMKIRYGDQLLGTVTISIGVIESSQANITAEQLLNGADKAMYAAKQAGRDRIIAYHDIQ